MNRIVLLIGLLLTFSIKSALAATATDYGATVTAVGTQSTNAMFAVTPALSLSGGCQYNKLYIDISTTAGKGLYKTLLLAYMLGQPIARVDYSNAGTGQICFVSRIEVTP